MDRNAIKQLNAWKTDKDRKPLILRGARQVGKTWLMKEFGRNSYDNYVHLGLDENPELRTIFDTNKSPERIVELISLISGEKIRPGKTLILLDEIQTCPAALAALKYFNEKANEYHIMAAGSLLGTLLAEPESYPVGKVNMIEMYPMAFDEFLCALDRPLYEYYMEIAPETHIEEIFHSRLVEAYNYYLIIGGMPECVASWISDKDPSRVDRIQTELIKVYEADFAKHSGKINSGRILLVFRRIASQLAKDNEKFIYGCLRSGARAREYEEAIEWLVSAGIVNRIYNVSRTEHPLSVYEVDHHFKLFLFDVGLLKHMAGVDNTSILLDQDFQFKGPLTENYVLQQLTGRLKIHPHYFSEKNGDLDFLIQDRANIMPVEVKAGTDKRAAFFKSYVNRVHPAMSIRFSKRNLRKDGFITNIPLYLACRLSDFLQKSP